MLTLSARTLLLHRICMWPQISTQCSDHSLLKQKPRVTIASCLTVLALHQTHYSMVFFLTLCWSRLSKLCSARFMFLTLGHKVHAARAPQNGSHGVRLEFIWGIRPSMPVVWILCLTHTSAKYLHSIMSSSMTLFQLSPTWTQNGSSPLGGPAPAFNQKGNQQKFRVSSGLD
jgi:hypothetical protein